MADAISTSIKSASSPGQSGTHARPILSLTEEQGSSDSSLAMMLPLAPSATLVSLTSGVLPAAQWDREGQRKGRVMR